MEFINYLSSISWLNFFQLDCVIFSKNFFREEEFSLLIKVIYLLKKIKVVLIINNQFTIEYTTSIEC